jgi:hypothetical protein
LFSPPPRRAGGGGGPPPPPPLFHPRPMKGIALAITVMN